jgi:capsular exopolysaccharide synthesis family protein
VTFAEYFSILQRRWLFWAAGLVLGVLAAITVCALSPVKYTANATLFVTVAERVDGSQGEIYQGSQFAVQRVKSYAPLATSARVLGPVADELGLDISHRAFAQKIKVSSPADTVLLDVAVTDPEPAQAARLADAVSRQLASVIEELETANATDVSNVRVSLAQPAITPTQPSSPRVVLTVILGAAIGLALGLVAAVLRHHLDRRVKTSEDVRDLTGMSPLGSTLHVSAAKRRPLVALDFRSASAERFRTIRTALKFSSADHELRHFAVTSAMTGEGKTSVACNLAISWAQTGASVCLVEADLRRPGAARFFGIDGSLGLSDVLVGEASLTDVLTPWHHGMLTVLPAGSLPPDPAALLGTSAMSGLVETLSTKFDVVIYDTPPVLSVTDAIVLGEKIDGVVLVVRASSSKRDQVAAVVEAFRQARLTLLGTVLTDQRARRRQYQYSSDLSRSRAELPPLAGGTVRTQDPSVTR